MLQFVLVAVAVAVGVSVGITFRRSLVSILGFVLLTICAVATAICGWFALDGLFLHRAQDTSPSFIVAVVGFGFFLACAALWEGLIEKPRQRKQDAEWAVKSAEIGAAVHRRMTAHITQAALTLEASVHDALDVIVNEIARARDVALRSGVTPLAHGLIEMPGD